jgi:hypothetical protein
MILTRDDIFAKSLNAYQQGMPTPYPAWDFNANILQSLLVVAGQLLSAIQTTWNLPLARQKRSRSLRLSIVCRASLT